jgi:hypothetical protein
VTRTRAEETHQDVSLVHPAETGAACANCHASRDVARLELVGGETVPLDHAYRLCGQCHFKQGEAWAGGGHGKRVAAWDGRRVVLNCTGCHDPHRPAFEKRVPFRGPTMPPARH